jgi:hypothetical protein
VPVRSHRRRQLSLRRVWRNAKRAWRAGRQRRHTHALVFGTVAAAELGAWAAFRGTGLVLTTIGVLAVGAGTFAMRATGSRTRTWR